MEGGGSQQGDCGPVDARDRREEDRREGSAFERLKRRVLSGYVPEPTPAIRGPIEEPKPGRVGVSCSGGGVRSAAYNLGVLQHLQAEGVLKRAKYLSAVSGGSYVAAAMTLARHSTSEPFAPGSPEEQYLRNRTTYLAPHGGEAIFFVYRMLLGLAINLLLFALVLGIPALIVGLILRAGGFTGLEGSAPPGWATWAARGFGAASLLTAAGYLVAKFSGETARRTVQTWAVRLLLVAAAIAFTFLLVPELVIVLRDLSGDSSNSSTAQDAVSAAVPAASLATILLGLIAQLRAKPRKELGEQAGKIATAVGKATPKIKLALVKVAGAIAVPLLALTWIVLVVNWTISKPDAVPAEIALPVAIVVLLALYFGGNLTSWSLHPFYRSRLATAFALERTPDGKEAQALDPYAIPAMADAQPPKPAKWPTLLVCAAANISDPGATPYGRPITAFTFSHDHLGGPLVGYVPTGEYEEHVSNARSDVMTAVAVSGAAVSPSMGKLTQRSARALLTLANVRLGVWLPNPRDIPRNDPSKARKEPRSPRPSFLLREMLGINTVRGRYLYVTDGGHYENLGLVELLRRGCTQIYCFDAGSGNTLSAFGEAIALARSELQVEISNVEVAPLRIRKNGRSAEDCLVADIRYEDGTAGKLLYARQLLTDDAPYDVLAHAGKDPNFPHDPIADQFFTDQRFEAYRAIGELAASHALAKLPL
jgi:hypothetical protein